MVFNGGHHIGPVTSIAQVARRLEYCLSDSAKIHQGSNATEVLNNV
jgi:hypothetical protein